MLHDIAQWVADGLMSVIHVLIQPILDLVNFILESLVGMMPGMQGEIAIEWLRVANWYLPINETVALFCSFCVFLTSYKVIVWLAKLKPF
jgi:hypothetical protein